MRMVLFDGRTGKTSPTFMPGARRAAGSAFLRQRASRRAQAAHSREYPPLECQQRGREIAIGDERRRVEDPAHRRARVTLGRVA